MAEPDTAPWTGLTLDARLDHGSRSEVWSGRLRGHRVAVRRPRRGRASLAWELDLMGHLDAHGVLVPTVVRTDDGRRAVGGVVVQHWLAGRMVEPTDVAAVAAQLRRVHGLTTGWPQRPGCATLPELPHVRRSLDADLDALPDDVTAVVVDVFEAASGLPTSVIHGDPSRSNVRITAGGEVALLDWDESRVDVTLLDLADLGADVLPSHEHALARQLADAWEVACSWTIEPDYARRRLARLGG